MINVNANEYGNGILADHDNTALAREFLTQVNASRSGAGSSASAPRADDVSDERVDLGDLLRREDFKSYVNDVSNSLKALALEQRRRGVGEESAESMRGGMGEALARAEDEADYVKQRVLLSAKQLVRDGAEIEFVETHVIQEVVQFLASANVEDRSPLVIVVAGADGTGKLSKLTRYIIPAINTLARVFVQQRGLPEFKDVSLAKNGVAGLQACFLRSLDPFMTQDDVVKGEPVWLVFPAALAKQPSTLLGVLGRVYELGGAALVLETHAVQSVAYLFGVTGNARQNNRNHALRDYSPRWYVPFKIALALLPARVPVAGGEDEDVVMLGCQTVLAGQVEQLAASVQRFLRKQNYPATDSPLQDLMGWTTHFATWGSVMDVTLFVTAGDFFKALPALQANDYRPPLHSPELERGLALAVETAQLVMEAAPGGQAEEAGEETVGEALLSLQPIGDLVRTDERERVRGQCGAVYDGLRRGTGGIVRFPRVKLTRVCNVVYEGDLDIDVDDEPGGADLAADSVEQPDVYERYPVAVKIALRVHTQQRVGDVWQPGRDWYSQRFFMLVDAKELQDRGGDVRHHEAFYAWTSTISELSRACRLLVRELKEDETTRVTEDTMEQLERLGALPIDTDSAMFEFDEAALEQAFDGLSLAPDRYAKTIIEPASSGHVDPSVRRRSTAASVFVHGSFDEQFDEWAFSRQGRAHAEERCVQLVDLLPEPLTFILTCHAEGGDEGQVAQDVTIKLIIRGVTLTSADSTLAPVPKWSVSRKLKRDVQRVKIRECLDDIFNVVATVMLPYHSLVPGHNQGHSLSTLSLPDTVAQVGELSALGLSQRIAGDDEVEQQELLRMSNIDGVRAFVASGGTTLPSSVYLFANLAPRSALANVLAVGPADHREPALPWLLALDTPPASHAQLFIMTYKEAVVTLRYVIDAPMFPLRPFVASSGPLHSHPASLAKFLLCLGDAEESVKWHVANQALSTDVGRTVKNALQGLSRVRTWLPCVFRGGGGNLHGVREALQKHLSLEPLGVPFANNFRLRLMIHDLIVVFHANSGSGVPLYDVLVLSFCEETRRMIETYSIVPTRLQGRTGWTLSPINLLDGSMVHCERTLLPHWLVQHCHTRIHYSMMSITDVLHLDHVAPFTSDYTFDNLQLMDGWANTMKGEKSMREVVLHVEQNRVGLLPLLETLLGKNFGEYKGKKLKDGVRTRLCVTKRRQATDFGWTFAELKLSLHYDTPFVADLLVLVDNEHGVSLQVHAERTGMQYPVHYARVVVRRDGVRCSFSLHRAVFAAFNGCVMDELGLVHHVNARPLDVTHDNLQRASVAENNRFSRKELLDRMRAEAKRMHEALFTHPGAAAAAAMASAAAAAQDVDLVPPRPTHEPVEVPGSSSRAQS